jgi:hypothetical protein
MTETAHFKIFCLECYKNAHRMKGRDAFNLFKQYGVLEYIGSFYDVLHSYGHQYIVQDIDEFIAVRRG